MYRLDVSVNIVYDCSLYSSLSPAHHHHWRHVCGRQMFRPDSCVYRERCACRDRYVDGGQGYRCK